MIRISSREHGNGIFLLSYYFQFMPGLLNISGPIILQEVQYMLEILLNGRKVHANDHHLRPINGKVDFKGVNFNFNVPQNLGNQISCQIVLKSRKSNSGQQFQQGKNSIQLKNYIDKFNVSPSFGSYNEKISFDQKKNLQFVIKIDSKPINN